MFAISPNLACGLVCHAPRAHTRNHVRTLVRCRCTANDSEPERSEMIDQELLLFIVKNDMDVSLQRALNYEQYDVAQEIRQRREHIETAIHKRYAQKGMQGGSGKGQAQQDADDNLAVSLTLQSQLNDAIANEDYAAAAVLRDKLKAIKMANIRAEVLSSEWDLVEPVFSLGQRVTHRDKGFRGVVAGWDKACCESEKWQERNSIKALKKGVEQPFYHILVDVRDWSDIPHRAPVAYVPEECLTAPALEGITWKQAYQGIDETPLQHPYSYLLYLGPDAAGDYVPTPQLREVYNVPRKDVYDPDAPDSEGEPEGDDSAT